MTNQEMFDKVASHLLKQGERSLSGGDEVPTSRCAYRGAEGRMCAIGCLIPDDKYSQGLEGRGVDSRVRRAAGIAVGEQELLASTLQWIHDTIAPEGWHSQLLKAAAHYSLNSEVCNAGK